jgi:polysaccharide pyruvyl transferase WcaK-like protein
MIDYRPKFAYVGGWTGKKNLGDEALLPAVQTLFPQLALFHFVGGRIARTALRSMPGLKCGILAGGTVIGLKGVCLEIAQEFLAHKKSMVLFGTGVEDPEFWPGIYDFEAWKPVLDRCTFLGVRGPISAEALRRLGYSNVRVVGDPVLAFARSEINRNPVPRSLGLNLGTADGRVFGGNEACIAGEMVKLAQKARREGWTVEWFVVWPKDLPPTLQAAAESQTGAIVHTLYHDYEEFIERARRLSTFVGMKLHATVLATCALTPSLMVEYRPKCRDYMQSIGQDAATIRADQFRAEPAWEIVRNWNERREETSLALAAGLQRMRMEQQRLAGMLAPHVLAPNSPASCQQ